MNCIKIPLLLFFTSLSLISPSVVEEEPFSATCHLSFPPSNLLPFKIYISENKTTFLSKEELKKFTVLKNMYHFFKQKDSFLLAPSVPESKIFYVNDSTSPLSIAPRTLNLLLDNFFPHTLQRLKFKDLYSLLKDANKIGFNKTTAIATALGEKFLSVTSKKDAKKKLLILKNNHYADFNNDEKILIGQSINLRILQEMALLGISDLEKTVDKKERAWKNPAFVIAFSSDNKAVWSDQIDYTVHVIDLKTNRYLAQLKYNNWVNAVAFSSDGRCIVTGDDDFKVKVWNVENNKKIAEFKHWKEVNAVCFSPDDKSIVSGGNDNRVRVWNLQTATEALQLKHTQSVKAVAFCPNGRFIISGGNDNKVRLWDFHTAKQIATFNHGNWVSAVSFSPDSNLIVSGGGQESNLYVWDWPKGKKIAEFNHPKWIKTVSFSPDSKYVVSGGNDKKVRVWNLQTKKMSAEFEYDSLVKIISFSSNGLSLVVGTSKSVFEYDLIDPALQANYSQLDFKELLEMLYSKKKLIEPTQQL